MTRVAPLDPVNELETAFDEALVVAGCNEPG